MSAKPVESGSAMVLNVSPLPAPDAAVQERVDAMERARSTRESAMFDEVLRCAVATCSPLMFGGFRAPAIRGRQRPNCAALLGLCRQSFRFMI